MRYFEDYQLGACERSAGRTLTETHVIQFCMLTGDWYPLHADKEWAEKEGPFGRRIAHGFLTQRAQILDDRGELKADYLSKILLRKRSGAAA